MKKLSTKTLWNRLVATPVIVAAAVGMGAIAPASALALEEDIGILDQVTSVSQLSDVNPTDWAFQALQSLVERYGCIAGYPDGTYRGNRAMTRFEFAAGVNACLDRITELIAASTADLVTRDDLTLLQRLQEEFAAELAVLRGRVDVLEARTAELEANQFSATTILEGEAIFALADAWGGDSDAETVLGYRTRLEFNSSFTGEDLLFARLQMGNFNSFSNTVTPSPQGDLFFGAGPFGEGGSGEVEIDAFKYEFPIGERTVVAVVANAGATDDFAPTINPFFDGDGGTGSVSTFGTRPSIFYLLDGAGIGVAHQFNDALTLSLGYLTADVANPSEGGGLFNGPFGALAQLTITPSEGLEIGLTYIRYYNTLFGSGSNAANIAEPEALLRSTGIDGAAAVNGDAFGFAFSWLLSDSFALGGWVGYTKQNLLSSVEGLGSNGEQDIWNWAVTLAFPDLIKEGSTGGIIVGMEPWVTDATDGLPEDSETSLHVEAFYELAVNDNIAITPAVIWITNPNNAEDDEDVVIGVIRTTFSF